MFSPRRQLKSMLGFVLLIAAWGTQATADEPIPGNPVASDEAIAAVVNQVRDSVVMVSFSGRDGKKQGFGTGFVVDANGLIATNLHVLGEARQITVQFRDGSEHPVTTVHATEKSVDLALIKIGVDGLPALELAPDDQLRQGQTVVAFGNPMGLEQSVVQGIVSAVREMDGQRMLQLAIPVEPGNSGSPVVDLDGRVHGLMSMKSRVTENLCFAAAVADLKPLIDQPNPIPMSRWLTIGALDPKKWQTRFGAEWRRRSGEIVVRSPGHGFGGRSLCLSVGEATGETYELGVHLRLDDESGAAGLSFGGDGEHKHYGFYPSNGRLRLTRFDGPTVFTWNVLQEVESEHYQAGQWNHLGVRVEPHRILCFVNDRLVIESTDDALRGSELGLSKFRDTVAHFRGFRTGEEVTSGLPTEQQIEQALALVEQLPAAEARQALEDQAEITRTAVERRAAVLEQQAADLRRIAADLHVSAVSKQLEKQFALPESEIDLARCVLLVARIDDPRLNVDTYLEEIDGLASEIRDRFQPTMNVEDRLSQLSRTFFEELGFHGCRNNYYTYANSYLNQVIDDREGLPIILSVLYMEVGRRVDVNVEGIGLPGRFIVGVEVAADDYHLIDVFDRGARLTNGDVATLVANASGREMMADDLKPVNKHQIVLRVLRNLARLAQGNQDTEAWLRYLTATLAVDQLAHDSRAMRAILRHKTGRLEAAIDDLDWFLDHEPEGIDLRHFRAIRDRWQAE